MTARNPILPVGWRWVSLGSVCRLSGGGTPSRKVARYFTGVIPWATPTDVTALQTLEITDTATTITEEAITKSSARLMPPGCVLLTSRATIGFTAINDVPMCTNQGFANFRCGPEINNYYLAYYFQRARDTLVSMAGGSIYKELSKATLKDFAIPLPPLPVQERIVQILQKSDDIRRKRQGVLKTVNATLVALFLDTFGDPLVAQTRWPTAPLGEMVADWQSGFATGEKDVVDGIPQVRMQNITTTGWFDSAVVRTVERHRSHDRYLLAAGDVLFNNTNSPELVGKTTIFREPGVWYLSNHISRLRPARVTPEYLWGLLLLMWVRGRFRSMCRQWVNQASVSRAELLKIVVPVPDDKRLLTHQDAVRRLEQIHKQYLCDSEESRTLFNSLLQRAFTGELTAAWTTANAEDVSAQIALHKRLPRLVLLEFLKEKARRAKKETAVLVTALMKYAFLFQMEGASRRPVYQFVPYHYGPFAKELYSDLQQLQNSGMVHVEVIEGGLATEARGQVGDLLMVAEDEARYGARKAHATRRIEITLTDEGRAAQANADLPLDVKEDVAAVVKEYGDLDHNALLNVVYEKYPTYARKSRLRKGRSARQ